MQKAEKFLNRVFRTSMAKWEQLMQVLLRLLPCTSGSKLTAGAAGKQCFRCYSLDYRSLVMTKQRVGQELITLDPNIDISGGMGGAMLTLFLLAPHKSLSSIKRASMAMMPMTPPAITPFRPWDERCLCLSAATTTVHVYPYGCRPWGD